MVEALLDRLRTALAGRPAPPLPQDRAPGRPGLADADRATWIRTFMERLDQLRGPGDADPAVVRVADAGTAAGAVAAAVAGVSASEILLPGEPVVRRDYRIGITPGLAGVAETGTILLDIADEATRWASLAVEANWIVLSEDQLVPDIVALYADVMPRLHAAGPRTLVQVTGSSRTADVEKIVVVPAHGPARLRVLLSAVPVDFAALAAALRR